MANLPQDPFTVLPEMFAAVRRDENAFKITIKAIFCGRVKKAPVMMFNPRAGQRELLTILLRTQSYKKINSGVKKQYLY